MDDWNEYFISNNIFEVTNIVAKIVSNDLVD